MIDVHHILSPEEKRERYGDGPWCDEPDRIEWRAEVSHYPCLALRHPEFGFWCGYVGLPPGHPLHGIRYQDADTDFDVHGGLTFAAECQIDDAGDPHSICHVPRFDEPADVWWLGFDCAHGWDLNPGLVKTLASLPDYAGPIKLPDALTASLGGMWDHNVYRDMQYVMEETTKLAIQLWERR